MKRKVDNTLQFFGIGSIEKIDVYISCFSWAQKDATFMEDVSLHRSQGNYKFIVLKASIFDFVVITHPFFCDCIL